MLNTSKVIVDALANHYASIVARSREARLIVPGLTERIAEEIHATLLTKKIPAYLVVSPERGTSESARRISPVGLTSKRIGSFVAITMPGQLAHVHDSVRGSGGPVRSNAFSEEWPWIDEGAEEFRFTGPIANGLASMWSADEETQRWIAEFLYQVLLPATKSLGDRSRILLEELLGTFSASLYPDIENVREKLLRHAGIPRPASLGAASEISGKAHKVGTRVYQRCREEDDIRSTLKDTAERLFDEEQQSKIVGAAERLLDRFGRARASMPGALTFFACWTTDNDWTLLTQEVLEQLFDIRDRPVAVLGKCSFTGDRVMTSKKRVLTFHGDMISVDCEYQLPIDEVESGWSVRISNRKQVLAESLIEGQSGTCSLTVDTGILKTFARDIPVRIALRKDDIDRAEYRAKLTLCGEQRQVVLLVTPAFEVLTCAMPDGDDIAAKALEVSAPQQLYVFSDSDQRAIEVTDEDGKTLEVRPGPFSCCSALVQHVDPAGAATGRSVLRVRADDLQGEISLESKDVERGEFTLEDEFRQRIATGRPDLREILALFTGESILPFQRLGKFTEITRRRIGLARDSQSDSWKPLLCDLLQISTGPIAKIGEFVESFGVADASNFRGTLSSRGKALIEAYVGRRSFVRKVIEESIDCDAYAGEHPQYAYVPIFVESRADEIANALAEYVQAYSDLVEYARTTNESEWPELFTLLSLDCVVHWTDGPLSTALTLIGPHHPLILAKRFMAQRAITARARGLEFENGQEFRHLTNLLANWKAFAWFPVPHTLDKSIEGAYVVATNDPGWYVAVRKDITRLAQNAGAENAHDIFASLRENWGLEANASSGPDTRVEESAIKGYIRAFPEKRAIGLRLSAHHDAVAAAGMLSRLLLSDEGERTWLGRILPGGVHLFLEGDVSFSDNSIPYAKAPIFLHINQSDDIVFKHFTPDIYMLPPDLDIEFKSISGFEPMPRGTGYEIAFCEPLRWVTEGRTGIPVTMIAEMNGPEDEQDRLPAAFSRALTEMQSDDSALALASSLHLPPRLTSPWAVLAGLRVDPAALVRYVRTGIDRDIQERALWDYRVDVSGQTNDYFVISPVTSSFLTAVKDFFGEEASARAMIRDLGDHGLAVGGEAVRSGRRAIGAIGLVGAIRAVRASAPANSQDVLTLVLPVDAFESIFAPPKGSATQQRADLLVLTLTLPNKSGRRLHISSFAVEAKCVSQGFNSERATAALGQADETVRRFRTLARVAREEWGLPERFALLKLIQFGLRIVAARDQDNETTMQCEASVARAILRRQFEVANDGVGSLVVSTEYAIRGAPECNTAGDGGLWVRLTKNHWPTGEESHYLDEIFARVREQFFPHYVPDQPAEPPTLEDSDAVVEGSETNDDRPENVESPRNADPINQVEGSDAGLTPAKETEDSDTQKIEKFLIGADHNRKPIYFDPHNRLESLDNLNIFVTGSSGTGKTQMLKHLVLQLRAQGVHVLLMDFKNDFAEDFHFSGAAGFQTVYTNFDGLPFNPLIPYAIRHPVKGESYYQPAQHIAGVADVLRRTYGLGPIQVAAVKDAMVAAYQDVGMPTSGNVQAMTKQIFPDLEQVGARLRTTSPNAYSRLDPLFNLELFRPEFRQNSFETLASQSFIIDVSRIPSEEIKNALAELVILSAHAYYNTQSHSGKFRQLLVFDEAHRVVGSDYMKRLVRECRAYGVGVLLSTQYPGDAPPEITSSMATKILHHNGGDAERVKAITTILGAPEAESRIATLRRFEAFLDNRHNRKTFVRTMNYPTYLLWASILERGRCSMEELQKIPGVNPEQLSVDSLINHLEIMGLVEGDGQFVWATT